MDRWRGKVAVITGASCGIGLAAAKALVREGMIVIGLSRNKDKMITGMQDVKGPGQFRAISCDVAKHEDVEKAFQYIKERFNTVHVLLNNAGLMKVKKIEDCEYKDLQEIVNVNILGAVFCSKEAIKLMKEHNTEAHIINMNSTTGHKIPDTKALGIGVNLYPPTKFALRALSEVLSNELHKSKIRVTNLSPGYVGKTNLFCDYPDLSFLEHAPNLKTEDIADSIVYILGLPKHILITELTIQPFAA